MCKGYDKIQIGIDVNDKRPSIEQNTQKITGDDLYNLYNTIVVGS